MKRSFWSAPPALALLAALAIACGGGDGREASAPGGGGTPVVPAPAPTRAKGSGGPVLVIAVDGLEWRVILPLLSSGKLPAIARLMGSGRYGKLASFVPTISQILWTSAATGMAPEKHGITTLLKETDGTRGARLYSSEDRKTKAVWNILTDGGLSSRIVGWWKTWPVEPIDGVVVPQLNLLYAFDASGMAIFRPERTRTIQGLVHPEAMRPFVARTATEVEASVASIAGRIFGRFRHPHSVIGGYMLPRMRWVLGMDEMHRRVALELLRSGKPWDVTMVYFRGADVLSHAFWRFEWPEGYAEQPTSDEIDNYGSLVSGYYRHMDTVIGELVEAAGPEATIIILSDHGMEAAHQDGVFTPGAASKPEIKSGDHEDAPPGVLIAAGPRIRGNDGSSRADQPPSWTSLESLGSIMDLTPTLLALTGLPVGDDMDGRAIEVIIAPDWLAGHPLRSIATHETPGWRTGAKSYRYSDEEVRERVEELRSIGYID